MTDTQVVREPMARPPEHQSTTFRILSLILAAIVALSMAGYGAFLTLRQRGPGESTFKLFGQEFTSNNVGLAAIFMAVVLFVVVVRVIIRQKKEGARKTWFSSTKIQNASTSGANSPVFVKGDYGASEGAKAKTQEESATSAALFEKINVQGAQTKGDNSPVVVMGNYTVQITQQIQEESKAKARKRWKEIGTGVFPGMSLSFKVQMNFLQYLLMALHRAFKDRKENFFDFVTVIRTTQTERNGETVNLFEVVCRYEEFCNQIQSMGRTLMEQIISLQGIADTDREMKKEKIKADLVSELSELDKNFTLYYPTSSFGFNEYPTAYRCIYDKIRQKIEIRRLAVSTDLSTYEDGLKTTDGVLQYLAAISVTRVLMVEKDALPKGPSTFRLLAAILDGKMDFQQLRVNVDDEEEWDYKNPSFDQEAKLA